MNNVTKLIILSGIFSLLLGCANTTEQTSISVGEITTNELFSTQQSFFTPYEKLTVSSQDILLIKQWPSTVHVEVFFGTWCHDSQREVPRLLKLLSYNPAVTRSLIALDYQKSEPRGLAEQKAIKYTPTIILYRNNVEIGRIIERPSKSLVADMDEMIQLSK
ncbi:MAG: thioredoxin family protein [Thalassotalea sp.]|nr:thioredoxin family protein [Thalassotalea sp.]